MKGKFSEKKEVANTQEAYMQCKNPQNINEIHELVKRVDARIDSLLKEEGNITFGLNNLLNGTSFTTQNIGQVEGYLTDLSENNQKTQEQVAGVFDI
jgi:methyl-accepting chemotaxis protein